MHVTKELPSLSPAPWYRICTDSIEAIRAMSTCHLPEDLRDDLSSALSQLSPASVTVVWVPGHAGIAGNELAHQLACKTLIRAPVVPWPSPPMADEAHFYKKTLKEHYAQL